MVYLWKKLLERIGVSPVRLQIGLVSSAEGARFAKIVADFIEQVRQLGPLWTGKEEDEKRLRLKLEAAKNLVPYVKLVESNKLKLSSAIEEAEYARYFASDEVNRLFDMLIAGKLAIGQIMLLLKEKTLSSGEIFEVLGMDSSEVSKYLKNSVREGLVKFDEGQKRFVIA